MEGTTHYALKLAASRIEVSRYEDAVDPTIVHFNCVDTSTGIRGIGTDFHPDLALLKAVSELLERRALDRSQSLEVRTSSGFAAHLDPERARTAAVLELYERDAFLLGWLKKCPPAWLTEEMISRQPGLADRLSRFRRCGFEARVGILAVTGERAVTAVAALRPVGSRGDFGMGVATSCGLSLSEAFTGTLLELHRIATLILNRRARGVACYEEVGTEQEVIEPTDHLEYYLNPSSAESAGWYWEEGSEVLLLDAPPAKVEIVEESRLLGPCFFVAHARSEGLQEYFCGISSDLKLNWKRIRQYHPGAVNRALHPLG